MARRHPPSKNGHHLLAPKCAMAQIALNRPRTPVAGILYGLMILYGCVAVISMLILGAR